MTVGSVARSRRPPDHRRPPPNLLAFTAGWLSPALAMAATFYQPAFAALTRWYGHAASAP